MSSRMLLLDLQKAVNELLDDTSDKCKPHAEVEFWLGDREVYIDKIQGHEIIARMTIQLQEEPKQEPTNNE